MANKKYVVELSAEERARLSELISKGKASAKVILKARILLKADKSEAGEGWADEDICTALDTNVAMVARVREKLVTDAGLEARLFPALARSEANARRPLPDWPAIHRELKRKGVTLQLLWGEHRAAHPDGHGYSRFCELYRDWEGRLSPTMRQCGATIRMRRERQSG